MITIHSRSILKKRVTNSEPSNYSFGFFPDVGDSNPIIPFLNTYCNNIGFKKKKEEGCMCD